MKTINPSIFHPAGWLPLLLFSLNVTASPIVVPFQLAGNSIVVRASVNGVAGNFLFDTSSPDVLLNSARFQGFPCEKYSEATDIHGNIPVTLCFSVKELKLGESELPWRRQFVPVLDLRNLEAVKGMHLHGIFGHSAFRAFAVMIDFESQELTLFPLGKNGDYTSGEPLFSPSSSYDLEMCGHIPAVIIHWKGKALRMGIDTGSEINVFDASALERKGLSIYATDSVVIRAISKHRLIAPAGFAEGISLSDWQPEMVQVVVADLSHIHDSISSQLDGVLGVPFFKKGKMAINYKRKKLNLWRTDDASLARVK